MKTPAYVISQDGKDLTSNVAPRLISLSITENRADEADTLDLTLDDSDGKLALPKRGNLLDVAIGWADTGVVNKGSFRVDEFEHSGAPDTITVRARSASMTKGMGERKEKSWHNLPIATIVKTIAKNHGLNPKVADVIGKILIPHIDQTHESDMSFLSRLAKRYDAVMNVKSQNLLFLPIGAATTASGKRLESLDIERKDGDRHRYHVSERENFQGVRAQYWSGKKAEKKSVTVGGENNTNMKVLPEVYPTQAEAQAAAQAEFNRTQRSQATMSYTLAQGIAELFPELPVNVSGFKPEIDATDWLVKRVRHELSDSGFTSELDLEMSDDPVSAKHRSNFRRTAK
jgi:hypothetical protein